MNKYFRIYPDKHIHSCHACPFRNEKECTFTGGPKFEKSPPKWVHEKCPKVNAA